MGGGPVVLLEARNEIIPIFVSEHQAQAIEHARQWVPPERPMTHDLFAEVLDDVGVTIDQVRIDGFEGGTFYATLAFTTGQVESAMIERDARPSDGIALAVRVDCPIRVSEAVIDETGQPPDQPGLGQAGNRPGDPARGGIGPDREGEESSDAQIASITIEDAVDIEIEDAENDDQDDRSEN